jgi:hypothetical protein
MIGIPCQNAANNLISMARAREFESLRQNWNLELSHAHIHYDASGHSLQDAANSLLGFPVRRELIPCFIL